MKTIVRRVSQSDAREILLPEAYDVYRLSDWAIWEETREGKPCVTYALITHTGHNVREIYRRKMTREELSMVIIAIANGGEAL